MMRRDVAAKSAFLAWLLGIGLVAGFTAQAANPKDFNAQGFSTKPTRIWTEPNAKFGSPIAEVEPGVELEILTYSTTRSWAKVRTPSGREGWIPVMHTSFSQPRRPVEVSTEVAETNADAGRVPASEGAPAEGRPAEGRPIERAPAGMKPIVGKGGKKPASSSEGVRMGLRLEYANELSREMASGFGLGANLAFALSERWRLGGGLDYQYFRESATDALTRSSRGTNKFLPHALLEYRSGAFAGEAGVGVEFDRTGIDSFDVATGGLLNSNATTDMAFALKLAPRYEFKLEENLFMSVHLLYKMTIDMGSGTGTGFTVDAPADRLQHVLGIGLGVAFGI